MVFFKDRWDTVKEDLMRVFEEFHENGVVNGIVNETYICLISEKKKCLLELETLDRLVWS